MFPSSTCAARKHSHSYAKLLTPRADRAAAAQLWHSATGQGAFRACSASSALKINFSLSSKDTPPQSSSQRLTVKTRGAISMNDIVFVSADAEAVTTEIFRKLVKGNS